MSEIKCARCPMCGGPPDAGLAAILSPEQWFCPNDDCDTFCWDATQTLDWNLTHATMHALPGLFGATDPPPKNGLNPQSEQGGETCTE